MWLNVSNWVAYPPVAAIFLLAPSRNVRQNWHEYRPWIIALGLVMPLLSTNFHLCTVQAPYDECFGKTADAHYENDNLSSLVTMVLMISLLVPLEYRTGYVAVFGAVAWLCTSFTSATDYGSAAFIGLQVAVATRLLWPHFRGDPTGTVPLAFAGFLISAAVAVVFKFFQSYNYQWMHGGAWHVGTGVACAFVACIHLFTHSEFYEDSLRVRGAPGAWRLRRRSRMIEPAEPGRWVFYKLTTRTSGSELGGDALDQELAAEPRRGAGGGEEPGPGPDAWAGAEDDRDAEIELTRAERT